MLRLPALARVHAMHRSPLYKSPAFSDLFFEKRLTTQQHLAADIE